MKNPLPLLLTLALLAGCNTGRIRTISGVTLSAPKDASAPSSVKEGQKVVKTTIPAGTVVVRESIAPTQQSPAIERETTSYTQPSEKVETEIKTEVTVAGPRAPDQQVALRNADNKARAPVLYAAIFMALLTGFLVYRANLPAAGVSGSVAAALGLMWYAYGQPLFMLAALVLVAGSVAFFIWRQYIAKQKTEETLRRTVQSVEEIKAESPEIGEEIKLYQEANLDADHKRLIEQIKPTIGTQYLLELAKNKTTKSNANPSRNGI